jgi:hypothetical protein
MSVANAVVRAAFGQPGSSLGVDCVPVEAELPEPP